MVTFSAQTAFTVSETYFVSSLDLNKIGRDCGGGVFLVPIVAQNAEILAKSIF